MPLWLSVVLCGIVIFAIFKFVFPTESKKIGIMAHGKLNLFINDRAKTPEGAEAIYTQAIEEARDTLTDADDMVRQLTGRIEMAKRDIVAADKEKTKLEQQCEALVKRGSYEEAEILAEKRENLLTRIALKQQEIEENTPLLESSQQVAEAARQKIRELEKRKVYVVEQLKHSIEYSRMVDSVDELKKSSNVDKMIASVDDGFRQSQERLIGAQASYNSRLEVKEQKALALASKSTSSSYVEELKAKYNK